MKIGDKIQILVDYANEADVRVGDILTVFELKNQNDRDSFEFEAEGKGCNWFFHSDEENKNWKIMDQNLVSESNKLDLAIKTLKEVLSLVKASTDPSDPVQAVYRSPASALRLQAQKMESDDAKIHSARHVLAILESK